mmetsp:Transcript_808/g.739  ORF Transcript_808/g.739 Transcript_808/m.739 type:complete len:333 (+) Transcript_808:94-1092(+)|eukprot:CAMPEP_0114595284 /NCGR_PEP_ID=MMETSP0125-20121206/17054_1 /TAXON_ID=485358 ORGANISM="Aristerostoma sp., Strain ATCC 50986" /NCGR_SAMPLE_ID=MMETSP0125 /ASSEMBLY_ACC=CAM_ASM_000245 /LENGTH=332 /DNA_ID=CAMNT_0001796661 /DNA_START=93 /DNA_END=1091 /DNA_ORIENTATION=+
MEQEFAQYTQTSSTIDQSIQPEELSGTDYIPDEYLKGKNTKVYLAKTRNGGEVRIMKVFQNTENGSPSGYRREIRFANVNHPNVISHYEHNNTYVERQSQYKMDFSYIVMEFCPFGDFNDVIKTGILQHDDKLVRTYFHQLVKGLYYLHNKEIAHLDLKPGNILLGKDYNLKICDFDTAYKSGDKIVSRGTRYYRPPELKEGSCKDPYKADIYALGTTLFNLMFGVYPHAEGKIIHGWDLTDLLYKKDLTEFFKAHYELGTIEDVDNDFFELFSNMVKVNPKERWTLEEIANCEWVCKEVYTDEELYELMEYHRNRNFKNCDLRGTKKIFGQ